jgi:hypothetical protein
MPTNRPDASLARGFEQSLVVRVGDLESTLWKGWHSIRRQLFREVLGMIQRWYTLQSTFRSFCGHIQTIRAIEYQSVDLGPAVQHSPDGRFLPCSRTVAHSDGIRCLTTKYPWADLVDSQVFLFGFDAGARWALSNADSASSRPVASCDTSRPSGATPEYSKRDL